MQRTVVLVLLGSALLLLAGCGGNAESDGGSDSNAPAVAEPTKRALPTMPSARFAAPTTMITPESARSEVSATATLTATEEMSKTEEVTATEAITETE